MLFDGSSLRTGNQAKRPLEPAWGLQADHPCAYGKHLTTPWRTPTPIGSSLRAGKQQQMDGQRRQRVGTIPARRETTLASIHLDRGYFSGVGAAAVRHSRPAVLARIVKEPLPWPRRRARDGAAGAGRNPACAQAQADHPLRIKGCDAPVMGCRPSLCHRAIFARPIASHPLHAAQSDLQRSRGSPLRARDCSHGRGH